jgi:uncharacterized small protein (DUF1192 family)
MPDAQKEPDQNLEQEPESKKTSQEGSSTDLSVAQQLQLAQLANAEQAQRTALLEQQIARLSEQPKKEKPGISSEQFFESPQTHVRDIVREELGESIAPLKDFVAQAARRQALADYKAKFMEDPQYKIVLERAGHIVDAMLQNSEITEATVHAAILGVAGGAALGKLAGINLQSAPANAAGAAEPPTAHLKPSGAPAAALPGDKKTKLRDLTEAEEAARAKLGITKDRFLAIVEGPRESSIDELRANFKAEEKK